MSTIAIAIQPSNVTPGESTAYAGQLAAHASHARECSRMCVGLSAWVGKNDTQVSFPVAAAGLEFFRSNEPDCDPADYASRADGQLDILADAMVRDTAATLSRPGYYALKHGDAVASLALNAAHFSGRYSYKVVIFKNQLWLIGGSDTLAHYKNDVWRSADGVDWRLGLHHTFRFPAGVVAHCGAGPGRANTRASSCRG